MHDYYDLRAQEPKRDPTLFAVVLAVVFKGEQRTSEDMLSVDEIHTDSRLVELMEFYSVDEGSKPATP